MNGKDRVWNLKLIKKAFWAAWKSMALMSWLVCLWATRRISSPKPSSLNCCTVYLQHLISLQMCCDKEWESSFWSEIWHKYTFPKRSICLLLTNAAHLGRFSFPFCCTAIAGHKDTPRLYCAHLYHTQKKTDAWLESLLGHHTRPSTTKHCKFIPTTHYWIVSMPSSTGSDFGLWRFQCHSVQTDRMHWPFKTPLIFLSNFVVVFGYIGSVHTCHLLTSVVFQLMELFVYLPFAHFSCVPADGVVHSQWSLRF